MDEDNFYSKYFSPDAFVQDYINMVQDQLMYCSLAKTKRGSEGSNLLYYKQGNLLKGVVLKRQIYVLFPMLF